MSDDASPSFDFAEPTRLTVGTEGLPGRRMFFLQAREGPLLATLKMEKIQVAALGSWIAKTLEDLPRPGHLPDDSELEPETFLQPAWAVGSLGGSYDPETDRILLVAAELPSGDDEDDDDPTSDESALLGAAGATARIRATREQMAALAIRATRLVDSGRPPCPLCGYPLDPIGHQCPRTNGFRPPNL